MFNIEQPQPINTLDKKRHYWIYGPSNCGKSTYVQKHFKDRYKVPYSIPEDWKTYRK